MPKLRAFAVLTALLAPLAMPAQGPTPDLPAASIQPKVKTACLYCHDSGIIVQQRLDKKTWGKEVDKMIRWGAVVEKQDRDPFVDYLSSNFPGDKPPAAPKYSAQHRSSK
jgi:hypothetical protein